MVVWRKGWILRVPLAIAVMAFAMVDPLAYRRVLTRRPPDHKLSKSGDGVTC